MVVNCKLLTRNVRVDTSDDDPGTEFLIPCVFHENYVEEESHMTGKVLIFGKNT
jgi:hypothetical protein